MTQYLLSLKNNNYDEWRDDFKVSYTYDANGNMTEELRQGWDNNNWVNERIKTFTFDANGNMTEEIWQDWQNSAWVIEWIETFT